MTKIDDLDIIPHTYRYLSFFKETKNPQVRTYLTNGAGQIGQLDTVLKLHVEASIMITGFQVNLVLNKKYSLKT